MQPLTLSKQLQIKAFGLNRMDISQREGNYPLPPGAPETLGVEFSGIVTELGEGSGQRWKVGDEVIGLAAGVSVFFPSFTVPGDPFHLTYAFIGRVPMQNTSVCSNRI